MFCDELKITVIGGKGGDGAATFRREKFVPRGGPDGGDGGTGGDIIVKVNSHLNTLNHIAHQKIHKGEDGVNGRKKNMHGKNGEAIIIEVPKGTMIFSENKEQLLADLTKEGQELVVSKGGRGGMGNARFASATHQAPKFAELGEPGQENEIILELKMVADLGLIGLPSAGKSTLISVISNAKPKIAAYHFTTLSPNLGVVNMSKFGGDKKSSFIAADIPGLIEGASEGKGLGHQFLKHITRTKLLLHLIDASLENIGADYKTINKELKDFSPELANRREIIVLNKIDILDEKTLKKKIKELQKVSKNQAIWQISGLTQTGLKPLMFKVLEQITEINKEQAQKAEETQEIEENNIAIMQPHIDREQFKIDKVIKKKDHKIFRITGQRIEQLLIMTDTKNPEGLERIYHYMHKMGIQKAVEKLGAHFGDKIRIKEKVIPYRK